MIKYTYDHELMTMSTMFLNCMSDIVVKRFNVHKQAKDQIKTRIVYAPKQRVLNDLLDKDQNLQLPVISVYIGGVARDETRVFNKIHGTYHKSDTLATTTHEKGALPVDVTYNVTIMTRYQQDMDQILSHLLPYLNPYFVISWRTPNRPDLEIRSNVVWSGNVNIQYPIDLNATQVARCVSDLSFVFKGWLFQNAEEAKPIFTFNTSFINYSPGIPKEYVLSNAPEVSSNLIDYHSYTAVPPRPKIINPHFASVGYSKEFNIRGTGMEKVINVYLSGAPVQTISTIQNPFAENIELSALYPPFMATKLPPSSWTSDKDSLVTFVMPSADAAGKMDVIIENPYGYGRLTSNVKINTFNPYDSSTPDYDSHIPYQLPYLSGIDVF